MGRKWVKMICLSAVTLTFVFLGEVLAGAAFVGDALRDGDVTAADARFVLRIAVGLESAAEETIPFADADGDGKITAGDAREVLRMSVGLTAKKPYYTSEIITQPTCDRVGSRRRVSTEPSGRTSPDGRPVYDEYTEEIPPLGHEKSGSGTVIKAPGCTENGMGKFICSRCGRVFEAELPALGHTVRLGKCRRCGKNVNVMRGEIERLKTLVNTAKNKLEEAGGIIEQSASFIAKLPLFASLSRPVYADARRYCLETVEFCGQYPEFAGTKKDLEKAANLLELIVSQIDYIKLVAEVNDSNFYELIGSIDQPKWDTDDIFKKIFSDIEKWNSWE